MYCVFKGEEGKKLTETLWRCILCRYNKNLGEQLAKTICLCLQSNLISTTSKEMLVKDLHWRVLKNILKEVRTDVSATNEPFWADQAVWRNFAKVSYIWGCFFFQIFHLQNMTMQNLSFRKLSISIKMLITLLLLTYTVVKWGHTEGIRREKTSSEKYTVFSL